MDEPAPSLKIDSGIFHKFRKKKTPSSCSIPKLHFVPHYACNSKDNKESEHPHKRPVSYPDTAVGTLEDDVAFMTDSPSLAKY